MNTVLWVFQLLLAVVFVASGSAKSFMSKARMIETGQTGVAPFPVPVIRAVAVLEVVGAVGLVLPWLMGVTRVLTPLAAVGLSIVMVGAAVSHSRLGEYKQAVAVNGSLFVLLTVVAVQRFSHLG